jgi:hypothetical protein
LATASLRTDLYGQCELQINTSGGTSGDTATITLGVSGGTPLAISVTVP